MSFFKVRLVENKEAAFFGRRVRVDTTPDGANPISKPLEVHLCITPATPAVTKLESGTQLALAQDRAMGSFQK